MPTDPLAPLYKSGRTLRPATRRALLAYGPPLAHHLIKVLGDRSYDADDARGLGYARAHAATLLKDLEEDRAIPALVRALVDTDRLAVATECLAALATFEADALDPLLAADAPRGGRSRRVLVALVCLRVKDDRIHARLGDLLLEDPWFGSLLAETYADPTMIPQLEHALGKLLEAPRVAHGRIGAVEVVRKAILALGGEVDSYHSAVMERIAHDVRDGRLAPVGTPAPRPFWPELGLSQAGR